MECEGVFQRPPGGGSYGDEVSKNPDYLEADYIANPHVTVTLGRFLTPFGMFYERLYPIWIRSLQQELLLGPQRFRGINLCNAQRRYKACCHSNDGQ
jgi:hypothetical protein